MIFGYFSNFVMCRYTVEGKSVQSRSVFICGGPFVTKFYISVGIYY